MYINVQKNGRQEKGGNENEVKEGEGDDWTGAGRVANNKLETLSQSQSQSAIKIGALRLTRQQSLSQH